MNSQESLRVLDLIRRIRDSHRLTIILVEHNMPLVMQLCERIQVLNYGQLIAEGTPGAGARRSRGWSNPTSGR